MLLWPKKRSYARHCLLPHSTLVAGAIPASTTQMQPDIIYTPVPLVENDVIYGGRHWLSYRVTSVKQRTSDVEVLVKRRQVAR